MRSPTAPDIVIDHTAGDLRAALRNACPAAPMWSSTRWAVTCPSPPCGRCAAAAASSPSGYASGDIPRIPLNLVLLKGVQVLGVQVPGRAARRIRAQRRRAARPSRQRTCVAAHRRHLPACAKRRAALRQVADGQRRRQGADRSPTSQRDSSPAPDPRRPRTVRHPAAERLGVPDGLAPPRPHAAAARAWALKARAAALKPVLRRSRRCQLSSAGQPLTPQRHFGGALFECVQDCRCDPRVAVEQIGGDRERLRMGPSSHDREDGFEIVYSAPRISSGRRSSWSPTRTVTSQPAITRSQASRLRTSPHRARWGDNVEAVPHAVVLGSSSRPSDSA